MKYARNSCNKTIQANDKHLNSAHAVRPRLILGAIHLPACHRFPTGRSISPRFVPLHITKFFSTILHSHFLYPPKSYFSLLNFHYDFGFGDMKRDYVRNNGCSKLIYFNCYLYIWCVCQIAIITDIHDEAPTTMSIAQPSK